MLNTSSLGLGGTKIKDPVVGATWPGFHAPLGTFRSDAPALFRVRSPNYGKVGNQVLLPALPVLRVLFWCNLFSSAVPSGSGAFLLPSCPSSVCPSRLRVGGVYLRNASVTFLLFSSAVPSGRGAFQISTRPSAASTLRGERPISETLE